MDRDEFMELVYETFADELDNVLANGIIEAADAYVEYEKAQLSKQCTTFDLISRQAALDTVGKYASVWMEYTDAMSKDEIAQIALNNAKSTMIRILKELPPAQPEPHEGEWVQIQRCVGDTQPDLECPFCKHRIGWFDMGRYCAGCGAKLKGGAG